MIPIEDNKSTINVFHGDDCPFIARPCPYIAALRLAGRKVSEAVQPDTIKIAAETIKEVAIVAQVVADELAHPDESDNRLKKSADAMAEADRKIIQAATVAPPSR